MRQTPLVLLSLLLPAACGGDATPAATEASNGRTTIEPSAPDVPADAPLVIVLGDSLAAGLHLAADEAWPQVLQRRAVDAGAPFRLVNAGVSGDTTAGGRARLEWLLAQDPDVLVVELGHNDGLRAVPVKTVEENLDQILAVAQAREDGPQVLLLGVRLPPNLGAEYVSEFEALYPTLAARHGVELVPFFLEGVGGNPDMNLPDGMHPTAEGHAVLAENVLPALLRLLTPASGG